MVIITTVTLSDGTKQFWAKLLWAHKVTTNWDHLRSAVPRMTKWLLDTFNSGLKSALYIPASPHTAANEFQGISTVTQCKFSHCKKTEHKKIVISMGGSLINRENI